MNANIKYFRSPALRVLRVLWMVGALLAAVSTPVRAELAANVHFVSGYVAATAAGAGARQLAKGDGVHRGDRVDTADNGRVQMRFTDGGLVSLMPNSTFSVDEYWHDGGPNEDASLVFGLLKGGLRTVTGTIGQVQHDQYELKTPVATLGIRGTEYVAVLMPANTLRVHVGRGKVVITNDQGSLEVPEGHNAVVTLGNAPELSERGPQYQATGPMGDRLVASYQHRQNPHLLNPRANMPEADEHDLIGFPGWQGGGSTPPVTPPPSSQDLMAISLADAFPNYLAVLSLDDLDPGDWTSYDVGSSGALSWGVYSDGTGTLLGAPLDLSSGDSEYMPYVTGSSYVATLPSGMLSYSLAGGTLARGLFDTSGEGVLNVFDFGIDLSNLQYLLNFELTMNSTDVYSANNIDGSLLSGSNAQGFALDDALVQNATNCASSGCPLDIKGFLAGPNAEQAGVTYRINVNQDDFISGAAALDRVP